MNKRISQIILGYAVVTNNPKISATISFCSRITNPLCSAGYLFDSATRLLEYVLFEHIYLSDGREKRVIDRTMQ